VAIVLQVSYHQKMKRKKGGKAKKGGWGVVGEKTFRRPTKKRKNRAGAPVEGMFRCI